MLRLKRSGARFAWALSLGLLGLPGAPGCASTPPPVQLPLAPAGERTTLAPGDVFQLKIVGEKDLPEEYQVASDGTVDLPYIHTLEVTGLEPQEVARLIRDRLIEERILSDPAVVVSVKEYVSKRVTLLGEVQRPGSFPLSPGLTLIQAVSQAGGLTSIANKQQVHLTRAAKNGRTNTVVLDIDEITEGNAPDIPLQPGDRIYVKERIF